MSNATRYALSVMCEDKVGLVARLTGTVTSLGGNIESLHQGVLQGYFVFMMLVTFKDEVSAATVEKAIESSGKPGEFIVSILPRKQEQPAPAATGQSFILTLTGVDSLGILRKITGYLASHRINIENLDAGLREDKCLIIARLTMPESLDIRAMRLDLAEILRQDQLTVSLVHEDIFKATSRVEMPQRMSMVRN